MSFYHPFINGSQLVTNGLISTFNANTLGNLFTTGGNVGIGKSAPTSALDVSGTVKADTINVTGITASNINFTGSLYQNGVAYSSSQWTTTSGNVSYTSGSIVGTSVSANNVITSDATIGTLTISNFAPATVNTTSLTTANFIVGNLTTGTLVTNNVNVGINSMYGGSFNAANNVAAASDVTGFAFNSSSVVSFSANVSVIVTGSTVSYETFTLNGAYSSSGWILNSSSRGDVSGIAFTITSGGQIQYTSTNVSGWSSSVFRFSVNQNSLTGNYSSLSVPTSGNTYIYDSINLTNTADAVAGSSVGSIYVSGGATVSKSLFVGTQISSANVISTNSSVGTLNATGITAGNINFTGNLYQNGAVFGGGASWNGFNVTASTSGNAWATTFSGTSFSSNGLDWVTCTQLRPIFKGVVYANNTWYASSLNSGGLYRPLLTSTDLVNWSYNTSASTLLSYGNSIAYGNNTIVLGGNSTASGNSIIYSTGGNVWTNSNSTLSGQCYTVAFNGSMFVAGGYGTNVMAYSTNGSTWTAITSNVPTSYCYGIAYGNSTWVATGMGTNAIAYSSNGTSWTGISNPFNGGTGYGVAFGNGKFVAMSSGGTYKILYSANGSSWTGVTLPSEFDNYSFTAVNGLTFNGTYFIIASGDPMVIYSSNGITWMYGNNPNLFNTSPSGIGSTGQTSSSLMISNQNISFSTGTAQTSYYNTSGTFVAPKSAYYNISMSAYGIGGISGSSLVLGGSGVTNSALNTASQFIYLSSGSTLQPYISAGKFQSWQVMYT